MLGSLTASAISFILINLAVFKVVKLFRILSPLYGAQLNFALIAAVATVMIRYIKEEDGSRNMRMMRCDHGTHGHGCTKYSAFNEDTD